MKKRERTVRRQKPLIWEPQMRCHEDEPYHTEARTRRYRLLVTHLRNDTCRWDVFYSEAWVASGVEPTEQRAKSMATAAKRARQKLVEKS